VTGVLQNIDVLAELTEATCLPVAFRAYQLLQHILGAWVVTCAES
jgi:hypothetical protein